MITQRTMPKLASLTVATLALLSCAGPALQSKVDVVRGDIDKARRAGAYECAPRELAMAESHADFAEVELQQGDFLRADDHVETAVRNANKALYASLNCARDTDGDGIDDKEDGCPKEPEDKDLFEDEDGCPDVDNDQDTVLDVNDKCPNTKGAVDNEGCPPNDKDGDGIPDKTDQCPDAAEDKDGDRDDDGRPDLDVDADGIEDCVIGCPFRDEYDANGKLIPAPLCDSCTVGPNEGRIEDKDGFEDGDGCPELDNDRDGLLDTIDQCPNEPGLAQAKGCPDSDGDGFGDKEDACPKEPGVKWEDNPAKNGCPPELKLVVIKKDRIEIKQQVQFDTGKATIKPVSAKLLGEVGQVIRMSPGIKKVTVEGHTDDVGNDDTNMRLSDARANSVKQWLIDKEKVDPKLLEAIGYGETKPIASNRTKQGKQQNRRVEFKVERE